MVFLKGNEMQGSGARLLDCMFFEGSWGLAFARRITVDIFGGGGVTPRMTI
jgi:hypothetical protein